MNLETLNGGSGCFPFDQWSLAPTVLLPSYHRATRGSYKLQVCKVSKARTCLLLYELYNFMNFINSVRSTAFFRYSEFDRFSGLSTCPNLPVLYPRKEHSTLCLNIFRREPAITRLD